MPFFSVVIPLYNKEHLIKQTIQSLINQSFKDFEVLIINDGSTDKSLEIVEKLIDNRFKIINQENKGASYARNRGINDATGTYIALLDADDFWYENHLLELRNLIFKFPQAGLYCNNYEINYNNNLIKPANFNFELESSPIIIKDYFKSSLVNSIAWTSSVAFMKMSFEKVGKFNLDLKTGQDIDLWIRFALNSKIAFNPIITMRYNNLNVNSLSKKEYNNDRYRLINGYKLEEQTNSSLKMYLDINRFAIAVRCKINNDLKLYKKLKNEIDYKNLKIKQKLLLNTPIILLKLIKRVQTFLIKQNIYINAFS